ncbi:MAG: transposase domain-containing protein [Salibacteraceae bacterium]
MNGMEPFAWLSNTLTQIPNQKANRLNARCTMMRCS